MAMLDVYLHGALQQTAPAFLQIDARDVSEAVRGIASQFPAFSAALRTTEVHVLRDSTPQDIHDATLLLPAGTRVDVLPAVAGAKSGAGKVVLGAALITASVLSGGMAAGASGLLATAAHAGMAIGVSMAAAGTSQLLTKTPNAQYENTSDSTKTNVYYDGPVNTAGQGLAIPLVYGAPTVGSVVVSAATEIRRL